MITRTYIELVSDRQFFDRYFLALRQEPDGVGIAGFAGVCREQVATGGIARFLLADSRIHPPLWDQ